MLDTELNITVTKQILERKLREGNLDYVNGMMYIITNTKQLRRYFNPWIDYTYLANQAALQRSLMK